MRRLFGAASVLAIALSLPVDAFSFPLPKLGRDKAAAGAASSTWT